MNQQIQPQEQVQPLMVQAMWFMVALRVIMGLAVVADVLYKAIEGIDEPEQK